MKRAQTTTPQGQKSPCLHKKLVRVEQDAGQFLYQCKLCLEIWTEKPQCTKTKGDK